ncbi:gag-pol polyprotein [Cucumis melo var. makuwa]|uniref:Gag-pol polyprotein n=2 Tax=Cucumis melo TaxID=3656 RepID=A0A5A7TPX9_CUCMM|nr:gag-pol polyprotein [Cucumis melo var. makuwa]TYK04274.1 gag-pol polyprotein [Cucumis melo var. makuwa]
MEIIREGPSALRPSVLDGKNYTYWKPRMIFFIKTLDGRAWRALVTGYEPPMITMDGVSILKPEVDWTDVEKQASVGNARALNAIFNGTTKVKISRVQLITSKLEALKMSEDESVSDYNERVLEIANESLLLGEKIPDSKILRKMAISDRENKKGNRVAFKAIYEEVTIVNQSDNEVNMNESIALLMEQFSKVVRKLENVNTTGSNNLNLNHYRRKDGENTTRSCSKHMTGNRSFFSEVKECTSEHVMLGDGAKGRILAKGNIEKYNLPCLNDKIGRIVDEVNVSDEQHSCLSIMILGIVVVASSQSSHLSIDVLASVLSRGTLSVWSVNEICVVSLSVKSVILHKIDFTNWFPSSRGPSAADQSQE